MSDMGDMGQAHPMEPDQGTNMVGPKGDNHMDHNSAGTAMMGGQGSEDHNSEWVDLIT